MDSAPTEPRLPPYQPGREPNSWTPLRWNRISHPTNLARDSQRCHAVLQADHVAGADEFADEFVYKFANMCESRVNNAVQIESVL